jgi:hypothetical protein
MGNCLLQSASYSITPRKGKNMEKEIKKDFIVNDSYNGINIQIHVDSEEKAQKLAKDLASSKI